MDGAPAQKLPTSNQPVRAVASLSVQAPSASARVDVLEPPTVRAIVPVVARAAETLAQAQPG
jgi:hypothetical protein